MYNSNDLNTASAVLLADGSLESTVLAYAYASQANQIKQSSRLTLLIPAADGVLQDLSRGALQQSLQERYPALTIEQIGGVSFPRLLFHAFHFQKNIAHFLWLVESAQQYGQILLAPIFNEVYIPGVPSPHEAIQAVNSWFEHMPIPSMRIVTPFQNKTFEAIVRLGIELGIDLNQTLDCEEPVGDEHCYMCRSCVERYQALGSINAGARVHRRRMGEAPASPLGGDTWVR